VNARSSALLGVGYGALSMALLGLTAIGSEPEPVATIGTITLELVDVASADFELTERVEWNPI
jgi:hypothetical protein